MPFYEVPQDQWVSFCDAFSRDHHGEKITVEVLEPFPEVSPPKAEGKRANHSEILARDASLRTLCFDRGTVERDQPMFAISLVLGSGRPTSHVVLGPTRLTLEQPADSNGRLRIETEDHKSTLLHLQGEAIPGMLDGMV